MEGRRSVKKGSRAGPEPAAFPLTDAERHILRLLSEGMTKKEIARTVDLSVHTVNFHLRRTYEKLQVHTNTGAVAKAIRQNLI